MTPDEPGRAGEDGEYEADLIRYDWLETGSRSRVIHYAPMDRQQAIALVQGGGLEDVRLACGQVAAWVCIPGWFTRQTAARCKRCCIATGLPQGIGSPKNDNACRPLVGLEPSS